MTDSTNHEGLSPQTLEALRAELLEAAEWGGVEELLALQKEVLNRPGYRAAAIDGLRRFGWPERYLVEPMDPPMLVNGLFYGSREPETT